jgi:hypothetical protein
VFFSTEQLVRIRDNPRTTRYLYEVLCEANK